MDSTPKTTLVFIPSPGTGHIIPTLEFAKRLIRRDERLSIKVLLMKFPFTPSDHILATSLLESELRIELIDLLPQPDHWSPPPEMSPLKYISIFIDNLVPSVRDILGTLVSNEAGVAALVLSFFCLPMMDVADELGLSSYLFLASSLGYLSLMLNHRAISDRFADGENSGSLSLPGIRDPIPPGLILPTFFPGHEFHAASLELSRRFRQPRGIVVNSFKELETEEVGYMLTGEGEPPPVYMVGPILDLTGRSHGRLIEPDQRDKIMKWLDDQPPRSVLFLCFGSMGSFRANQLREIAAGIERSGCRFLWSVRPPSDGYLPEGFSERTRGRGMVETGGWVPQMAVLAHVATAGFVSHCGWSSVLESLWWGVPAATLPIGAEQPLNAFRMAREWGLAVEIRSCYRDEATAVVAAEEIEAAVRRVMEEGEVRRKMREMSEKARKAVENGGSSFNAVGQFISHIMAISNRN